MPTAVIVIHMMMMASVKMISVHFLSLTGPSNSGGAVSISCMPVILPRLSVAGGGGWFIRARRRSDAPHTPLLSSYAPLVPLQKRGATNGLPMDLLRPLYQHCTNRYLPGSTYKPSTTRWFTQVVGVDLRPLLSKDDQNERCV